MHLYHDLVHDAQVPLGSAHGHQMASQVLERQPPLGPMELPSLCFKRDRFGKEFAPVASQAFGPAF